jgi:hypothetical protein
MEMKHPFKQKKNNGLLIREFNKDVDSDELVWHRDRDDRYVTVNRGRGWKLQLENHLPVTLSPGKTYFIPARTYHRVLKGQSNLVVTIKEDTTMKITKKKLTQLISELSIPNPRRIDDQDELNLEIAMKIKDMMSPDRALGMPEAGFRDLVVDIYETHYDPDKEGWEPYDEDLESIENHLTVVPLPDDDDYEPEEHDRFYKFEKEYDESGPSGQSWSFRKNEIRKRIKSVIREVLEEDKSGKGKCPDSGCIKKSGDKWRIISNKTGKLWPQKYETRKKAESALDAYHASR